MKSKLNKCRLLIKSLNLRILFKYTTKNENLYKLCDNKFKIPVINLTIEYKFCKKKDFFLIKNNIISSMAHLLLLLNCRPTKYMTHTSLLKLTGNPF